MRTRDHDTVTVDNHHPVALVTGASGGLGAAIARDLAAQGWRLVLTYRHNRPETLVAELDAAVADTVSADLTDADQVSALLARTGELGGLDTLVHAAGPHVPMIHLSRVSPTDFAAQLNHDATAFFTVMSAALPQLRAAEGSVVAVTTAATQRYHPRDGLSAGPKGAVESLARAFAAEEGRFGVRVNCVGPGMITDGMAERLIASGDLDDRALETARNNIPLRSCGSAEDIAAAVSFLSSDRARYISGQKLDVDGAYGV